MAGLSCRRFDAPDEVRAFEKGRLELLSTPRGTVGRFTLEPGWRWSAHVKHIAGTELCEARHFQYQVSGRLHVVMRDGTEAETGPGDVTLMDAGHEAWVVGSEPVVLIDWAGTVDYARPKQAE